MNLHDFVAAAAILLAATTVTVAVFKRIGLGSVLGLLAAGVVVGPWGLAVTADVSGLRQFAEIGVVFLLFIIGLEMRPEKLWSMRRAVFGLGAAQVIVTGALLAFIVSLTGVSTAAAIIVGFGLALSSTAFVVQILSERGELPSEQGQNAFAILLLQDIAIVPLLALVPLLAGTAPNTEAVPVWQAVLMIGSALAGLFAFGLYLLPRALHRFATTRNREGFAVATMLSVIGAAWVMDELGVSMALGAFVMGMLLSGSDYRHQIEAVVEPFKGFLLGLFFISVGMSIDVGLIVDNGATAVASVLAVLVCKFVVLFAVCKAFRLRNDIAIRVALYLPQSGEFGFVLFGAAASVGLLSTDLFNYLILVISVSMIGTPLLAKLGDTLATKLAKTESADLSEPAVSEEVSGHVIVCGFGRVGRTVCLLLRSLSIPYVAVDMDPYCVAIGKRQGHPVHYGDVSDEAILAALGVARAACVVLTIADSAASDRVVSTIRNFYPGVRVQARAHSLRRRDRLLASGVNHAVPEAVEGSLFLGFAVLSDLGTPSADIQEAMAQLRQSDYALIRSGDAG